MVGGGLQCVRSGLSLLKTSTETWEIALKVLRLIESITMVPTVRKIADGQLIASRIGTDAKWENAK